MSAWQRVPARVSSHVARVGPTPDIALPVSAWCRRHHVCGFSQREGETTHRSHRSARTAPLRPRRHTAAPRTMRCLTVLALLPVSYTHLRAHETLMNL
eukprot:7327154-Prymnesium_polylepis.1